MQQTASITFHVNAECEACSHKYEWTAKLSETTSNALSLICKDPTPGLMKQIGDMKFGLHRCPKCNYLQSWMTKQWNDRNVKFAIALSIPFFILVGKLIGWPYPKGLGQGRGDFSDLMRIGFALLGYLLLFALVSAPFQVVAPKLFKDPNRDWHKKNGAAIPAPKLPNVQPIPQR